MNLAENNLDYTNMQICALSDLHLHLKQSIVGTAHKCRYYTNTKTNTNTITNNIQICKSVHSLKHKSWPHHTNTSQKFWKWWIFTMETLTVKMCWEIRNQCSDQLLQTRENDLASDWQQDLLIVKLGLSGFNGSFDIPT